MTEINKEPLPGSNSEEQQIEGGAIEKKKSDLEIFKEDLNFKFKYVESIPAFFRKYFQPRYDSLKSSLKEAINKVAAKGDKDVDEKFIEEMNKVKAGSDEMVNKFKKTIEEIQKESQVDLNNKKKIAKERKVETSGNNFDLLFNGKKISLEFNENNYDHAKAVYDYLNKKIKKQLTKNDSLAAEKLKWVKQIFGSFEGKSHNIMRSELGKWVAAYEKIKPEVMSSPKVDDKTTKAIQLDTDVAIDTPVNTEQVDSKDSGSSPAAVEEPVINNDNNVQTTTKAEVVEEPVVADNKDADKKEPPDIDVENIKIGPALWNDNGKEKHIVVAGQSDLNIAGVDWVPVKYDLDYYQANEATIDPEEMKLVKEAKDKEFMVPINEIGFKSEEPVENNDEPLVVKIFKDKNAKELTGYEKLVLSGDPFVDTEKLYEIQGTVGEDFDLIKRNKDIAGLNNSLVELVKGIDAYLNNEGESNPKVAPRPKDQETNEIIDKTLNKRKEVILKIIDKCKEIEVANKVNIINTAPNTVVDNNAAANANVVPAPDNIISEKDTEKALYKIFSELGSANFNLQLEWKKMEQVGDKGKVESVEYQAKLKPESIKEITDWLDKYNLPADKKSEINQKIVADIESRFTQSIRQQTELEASHVMRHSGSGRWKLMATGLAATVTIAGARVLLGVGEVAASAGSALGRMAGITLLGGVAGGLKDKMVKIMNPAIDKLVGKGNQELLLEKISKEKAESIIKDDVVKIVGKEVVKQIISTEVKKSSVPELKTIQDLIAHLGEAGIFTPEQTEESKRLFTERLQKIFMVGERTDEKLIKFMQRAQKDPSFFDKHKGVFYGLAGGIMSSGAVEIGRALHATGGVMQGLPLLSGAVMGAQTYGAVYENMLKRARIEYQYGKVDSIMAGITEPKKITSKQASEVQAYLELGLLSLDPVMESRAMSFVQTAAENGVSIFDKQVESEKKSITRSLKIQSAVIEKGFSKVVGFSLGFLAGAATTAIAREYFGAGQPKGGAAQEQPAKSGGPSLEHHDDVPVTPKVVQSVEIKGSINTFTEAIDKAVHSADVSTQDNFIHKVLTGVEVTQANRGQLLDRAVEVLSVSNLKMGDAVDVQNLVYKGNHLELKSDGSWEVIKGSSHFEAKAVDEAILRKNAQANELNSNKGKHDFVKEDDLKVNQIKPIINDEDGSRELSFEIKDVSDLHLSNKGISLKLVEILNNDKTEYDIKGLQLIDEKGEIIEDIDAYNMNDDDNIQAIVAAKADVIQNIDNNLNIIKSHMPVSGDQLSLSNRATVGHMVDVDLKSNSSLSDSEISNVQAVDKLISGHSEYFNHKDFVSFIGKNHTNLTTEQVADDYSAFVHLKAQGYTDINVKDLHNFVSRPNSWLDLVNNKNNLPTEGLKVKIEPGQLVTSLKSPLLNENIVVGIDKTNFNNEVLSGALNKATNQFLVEQQLYNGIKATVGDSNADEILNLKCSEATQANLKKITSGFLGLQSGRGAAMHEYLSKTLGADYASKSGTVGEELSRSLSSKGVTNQNQVFEEVKSTTQNKEAEYLAAKNKALDTIKEAEQLEARLRAQDAIDQAEKLLNKK